MARRTFLPSKPGFTLLTSKAKRLWKTTATVIIHVLSTEEDSAITTEDGKKLRL